MKKSTGLLLAMAMMSMGGFGGVPNRPIKNERRFSPNERRKCFRSECNNHRNGPAELYCSEECKKLYKEENKK